MGLFSGKKQKAKRRATEARRQADQHCLVKLNNAVDYLNSTLSSSEQVTLSQEVSKQTSPMWSGCIAIGLNEGRLKMFSGAIFPTVAIVVWQEYGKKYNKEQLIKLATATATCCVGTFCGDARLPEEIRDWFRSLLMNCELQELISLPIYRCIDGHETSELDKLSSIQFAGGLCGNKSDKKENPKPEKPTPDSLAWNLMQIAVDSDRAWEVASLFRNDGNLPGNVLTCETSFILASIARDVVRAFFPIELKDSMVSKAEESFYQVFNIQSDTDLPKEMQAYYGNRRLSVIANEMLKQYGEQNDIIMLTVPILASRLKGDPRCIYEITPLLKEKQKWFEELILNASKSL